MPGIAPDPEQRKFHTAMRHFGSPASDSLPNQASREGRHPLFKNEQFADNGWGRDLLVLFRCGATSAAATRRF
jgi:hypothetical protein